jgi:cytochrome c-type biogenesis protein CcmH/NrfG
MKKNKEVIKSQIRLKDEGNSIRSGVSKGNVILIGLVCLLVGFILGATVAILKTISEPKLATSAEEPKQSRSIDNEEEIRLSKSILGKDPNNVQALISLGNAYFDTDRYQEAIDAYSKALAIDPKNPDIRTDMGIMNRKLGQFDKAIEAFRQAARDDPKHLNSQFNLGVALKNDMNDYPGAIQAWEEFLKLEPLMKPDDGRIKMVRQEIQDMKAALLKR